MTTVFKFRSCTINLGDFDIDSCFGFVSPGCAFTSSLNPYYEAWNSLLKQIPSLLASKSFRKQAASLPQLTSDKLRSDEERRYAYVCLACFVQAYVFEDVQAPNGQVPLAISQPFIDICTYWGLQPVLGHIGYCLWNWRLKDGSDALRLLCMRQDRCDRVRERLLQNLNDFETFGSFTGTHDEKIFCMVALLVEVDGGPLVHLLLDALLAGETKAAGSVIIQLKAILPHLESMTRNLHTLNEQCDPKVFYHQIRPFISGSKGMEGKGLPSGITFELANGQNRSSKCIGASAAQSSLFQFVDHVFGIEHNSDVLQEMRLYMPQKHREFLELVESLPSLRDFVEMNAENDELRLWFDKCIAGLRTYRTKHIGIATRYIVVPARAQARSEGVKGTGGSLPLPFLKKIRDGTV